MNMEGRRLMEAPQGEPGPGPLADKLNRLIDLKRKPDGQTFANTEIAAEVSRLYAEDRISALRAELVQRRASEEEIEAAVQAVRDDTPLISRSYISDLRKGKRDNPTKAIIVYLARFFGISPAFFFEGDDATTETKEAEEEVELIVMARQLKRHMEAGGEDGAEELLTTMMRGASGLSPRMAMAILRMQVTAIEQAKQIENGQPPTGR